MSSSRKLLEKGIETRNDPYPTRNALQVRVRHSAFYRAIQNYISIGFVKDRQVKISDRKERCFGDKFKFKFKFKCKKTVRKFIQD